MATKYRVTYERDRDGWWVASIGSVPGCHTQGRSIRQARARIEEALALCVGDAKAERAELEEVFVLPKAMLQNAIRRTESQAVKAARESAILQQARRDTARQLADSGVSVRDIGELLGISHQRAQQLIAS